MFYKYEKNYYEQQNRNYFHFKHFIVNSLEYYIIRTCFSV